MRLELSAESVRYYASLVEYYTAYKLKRMDREAVYLYLLCFIHDRYQRLNDNLLGAFCSLVRRYVDEVAAATKEAIYPKKSSYTLPHETQAAEISPQGGHHEQSDPSPTG